VIELLMYTVYFSILALLSSSAQGRDITFPPVNPLIGSANQAFLNGQLEEIDVATGSNFAGLTTFANLPYVQCLSAEKNIEKYDVAFMGAPFDTGVTSRPGARFGPGGIRAGSIRISPDFAWSVYTGENTFKKWARIVDCGDAPLTHLDNTLALKQLGKAHQVISGRPGNSSVFSTPRIIMLGGDHTTTLAALRSTFDRWGQVSVIHFDSHLDTWDPEVLGGGISHYAGVNHGTFLHVAHEEGLIKNTSIHAGIRAPMARRKGDLRNDVRCGFDIVKARDIDRIGVSGIVEKLKKRVEGSKVYISVDIDVLDPAFAPGKITMSAFRR